MSRSVEEWIGRDDDDPIPRRVRDRVYVRADGCCANCGRRPGTRWTCDHIVALVNGGQNREGNLRLLCDWCNKRKNAADAALKAKIYRTRAKHTGNRARSSRPFPCGRNSRWKKKIDGTVIAR